ncbi:MAG: DUF177 domain-containing protein [Betaproteobacteria bacterium]
MATRSATGNAKRDAESQKSRRFDAFRLARERARLAGSVDAAVLPRVADRVLQGPAPIEWRIDGAQDAFGRPAVAIALDGTIELECQRCLQAQALPVHSRTLLVLARDDADLARLDAESDDEVVLAGAPLDPAQLVEDELVLALPYAPRHADGECVPPHVDGSDDTSDEAG